MKVLKKNILEDNENPYHGKDYFLVIIIYNGRWKYEE
jgi:hypothetical protein